MNPLDAINGIYRGFERLGLLKRTPAFLRNYEEEYPYFKELEQNHSIVREECEALLGIKEQLHDVQGMAGTRTVGGIHSIQWKSFMFKAGEFVEENCMLCPETAKILKRIPNIKQAFFSILYPNQYIKSHRGYYYGFMRYHLGVIIPDNNREKKCWLRVHDDIHDNDAFDRSTVTKGEKYFWKNGEGIIFNDNYIHDASNESDEIRVVLWIDVERKLPIWINWFNKLLLKMAYKSKQAKNVFENAKLYKK
ncbi:MAG: aspartyl/asparaginyl beta-hydroxylase domain-containing protein [Flammeovirgaceae bacterium]